MARKYKQRGYMEDSEQGKPREKKAAKDFRLPPMPGFTEVFRCALCGTSLPVLFDIKVDSQCPKCKANLHSCKNCMYFDPQSRFECTQPIPERIPRKDLRNECGYFEAKKAVERDVSSSGSRADEARKAFENLFKK